MDVLKLAAFSYNSKGGNPAGSKESRECNDGRNCDL